MHQHICSAVGAVSFVPPVRYTPKLIFWVTRIRLTHHENRCVLFNDIPGGVQLMADRTRVSYSAKFFNNDSADSQSCTSCSAEALSNGCFSYAKTRHRLHSPKAADFTRLNILVESLILGGRLFYHCDPFPRNFFEIMSRDSCHLY